MEKRRGTRTGGKKEADFNILGKRRGLLKPRKWDPIGPHCRNCRYWRPDLEGQDDPVIDEETWGWCLGDPPTAVLQPDPRTIQQASLTLTPDQEVKWMAKGVFPMIKAKKWCGAHKRT